MKRVRKKAGARRRRGISWAALCAAATALPGVEEGTSYGTPSLRVRKKLLARLREDGRDVVLPVSLLDRDALLESDPDAFHVTDHYRAHPYVLMRLDRGSVGAALELIEEAWLRAAPRSVREQRQTDTGERQPPDSPGSAGTRSKPRPRT